MIDIKVYCKVEALKAEVQVLSSKLHATYMSDWITNRRYSIKTLDDAINKKLKEIEEAYISE
jgi:hypothetical protein